MDACMGGWKLACMHGLLDRWIDVWMDASVNEIECLLSLSLVLSSCMCR